MKKKLLASMVVGGSLALMSAGASAGWEAGKCPEPHTGPAPCIERNNGGVWEHFNGTGGHDNDWHGPFEFEGTSTLGCSIAQPTCTLKLVGNVQKFQDDAGQWNVGIQVVSGQVSGGLTCNGIALSNFPWYAGSTATHSGFSASTGIPVPGPLVGNMGDISLTALGGLISVNNAHVDNISFDNNGTGLSFFNFSSKLFTGGAAHNDSGCKVDGKLYIKNYDDVNIYPDA